MKGADFIVNVTNDAWFGDTPGPYQHFRSAQIRAAETGLPLVRAANNGISGAIDSRGRVIDAFALNVRGEMDVSLDIPDAVAAAARRSAAATAISSWRCWRWSESALNFIQRLRRI